MINPQPDGLFSHSFRVLYRHPIAEWLITLERIRYKADTIHWFYVHSERSLPLMIEEYVPMGILPEALFSLNQWGVHKITGYWAYGVYPEDYVRPWVMTKEASAGPGYHPILTNAHHYVHQNVTDAPNSSGNMLCPPPTNSLTLSLPILWSSLHNHLPPPDAPAISPQPLSPLDLPVPVPFQHMLSIEQTTISPVSNTLPSFVPYAYTDPFSGNRLASIPDLEKENKDPTHPTSPPYDPEQVVRDHEVLHPLLTPPQPPTPTPVPTPFIDNCPASPIIIDMPTSQSPVVPVEEDWRDRVCASEAVWPGPPMPSLLPLSPPPPSSSPEARYYWKCGYTGHLIARCPIMGIRA